MSTHSKGVVGDDETLARFVFSPLHVRKNGAIKPSLFSHVMNQGCSIQRESLASDRELSTFLENFLSNPEQTWHGVVVAPCRDVRSIKLSDCPTKRTFCVYDTSERENPAHAEIFQSLVGVDNGDQNELRAHLLNAFNGGTSIYPTTYRNGSLAAFVAAEPRGATQSR